MLTLSKLQCKFGKPMVNQQSKKHLRISAGSSVCHTEQHGKIINDKSIEWSQNLVMPLMFNREYQFEIYEKHQFGYNQKEFQTLLKGTFQISSPSQTWNTWEIYSEENVKVGFLSADISIPKQMKNSPSILKKSRLGNQSSFFNASQVQNQQSFAKNENKSAIKQQNSFSPKNQSQAPQNGKVLRIASIVAKITGSRFKKGFVVIQIGNRSVKTKPVRSRAGELVFIESEQIDYYETDTDAEVYVYSVDVQNQQKLIASGTLQLLNPKPPRNIGLSCDGYEAGQMLIDSKIQAKNSKGKTNFSKIFKQNNAIFEQSSVPKKTSRQEASKSVNFTRLQDFGISQTSRVHYYGLDSSRSTLSPRKKNSVVNGNSNIPFPRQKRFMLYQDRQNQRISYLRDRSFDFKSPQSGKYYKGAAFGYGDKTDFVHGKKAVPGVGNYHLPSIWDRY